ncbi:Sensor histidine kinase TodS, partial [termite gut metagenome]
MPLYKRYSFPFSVDYKQQIAQIEKDKSEELTHIKLRYFTNISHDFLTPLTIIACLIDDAENTFKGTIKQFETIRSNINRLRRLLQQVLDFRKIESGNMHLKLSGGDIALFIKDVCYTNFLPLMNKKGICFSFTSDPNQIPAHFDADKIDKIVFNLLSNAFKYTPSGGEIKIELLQYIQKQHTCLSIRISDTGIGIAKDDLKHIFTRFYTNRMGGAAETNGIGLSLVKELLDLHHGAIRVESEINKGTVFTIDLPIDKESYSDSGTENSEPFILLGRSTGTTSQEQSENETTDDDPEKDNITLLLVEDNEDLRTIIQSILSKHYQVLTAQNGTEALSCIKENKIDIIISDVMMPEIDGLELCRILKRDLETSHIPVILLTARNSTDDRIECYNAGADGYISKPFDLKVLEARINNFITNKRNRQKEFKEDVEINISTLEYPTLDEQFLDNAIRIIEEYLPETKFDINLLAENLHMSKSSLYRKIKTMTGLLLIASLWIPFRLTTFLRRVYFYTVAFIFSVIFIPDLVLYHYWGFRLDSTPLFYFFSSQLIHVYSNIGYSTQRFHRLRQETFENYKNHIGNKYNRKNKSNRIKIHPTQKSSQSERNPKRSDQQQTGNNRKIPCNRKIQRQSNNVRLIIGSPSHTSITALETMPVSKALSKAPVSTTSPREVF